MIPSTAGLRSRATIVVRSFAAGTSSKTGLTRALARTVAARDPDYRTGLTCGGAFSRFFARYARNRAANLFLGKWRGVEFVPSEAGRKRLGLIHFSAGSEAPPCALRQFRRPLTVRVAALHVGRQTQSAREGCDKFGICLRDAVSFGRLKPRAKSVRFVWSEGRAYPEPHHPRIVGILLVREAGQSHDARQIADDRIAAEESCQTLLQVAKITYL